MFVSPGYLCGLLQRVHCFKGYTFLPRTALYSSWTGQSMGCHRTHAQAVEDVGTPVAVSKNLTMVYMEHIQGLTYNRVPFSTFLVLPQWVLLSLGLPLCVPVTAQTPVAASLYMLVLL